MEEMLYSDEAFAVGLVFTMKGVEQGQLFYTGRTPGRPEVEQQGFASKRPHGQLGALGRVECLGPKCLLGARLHSAWLQAPPGQALRPPSAAAAATPAYKALRRLTRVTP